MLRTVAAISGRAGKPPSFGAANMRVGRGERGLNIEVDHPRFVEQTDDEIVMHPSWVNHGETQRRVTSLALLKSAMGLLRLACGVAETDKSKYDHIRDAIAGDTDVPVQHGFGNSQLPGHALQMMALTHEDLPGVRISLDYFGVELWAETQGPRAAADEAFLKDAV
jgi:hypothetical protein